MRSNSTPSSCCSGRMTALCSIPLTMQWSPGRRSPLMTRFRPNVAPGVRTTWGRRLRKMKQPREHLAQSQRFQPGLLCAAVDGAIDRRADAVEILLHAVADPGRLRERRRSVVEIDALQDRIPLFCSNSGQCGVVLVYHIRRGLSRAFGRQDHARDQPEAAGILCGHRGAFRLHGGGRCAVSDAVDRQRPCQRAGADTRRAAARARRAQARHADAGGAERLCTGARDPEPLRAPAGPRTGRAARRCGSGPPPRRGRVCCRSC